MNRPAAKYLRAMLAAAAAAVAAVACARVFAGVPATASFDEVRARWRPSDAQLLDRNGNPIHETRIEARGRRLAWTGLDDISPALKTVVLECEDRRFPTHRGVDLIAAAGALAHLALGGRARGASTITMQLAPMLSPGLARAGRGRTPIQKLGQMRAALALEHRWSKDQILEAYLNLVTYRGEIQGIGAASRVMLGKTPDGITPGEALVLAALLRAPNARRAAVERRAETLRSRALGLKTGAQAPTRGEIAAALDAAFARPWRGIARVALAPHAAERLMGGGQTRVRCTLDRDLQRFAAETLRRHVAEVRDRKVDDGAVIVAENRTGEVWAYVGGTGDLSSAAWVDGVRATRQPGSALKPFLYALALDRRILTPASILEDSPLELPQARGIYRPLDYDRRFRGMVSMRTALASSLNIPAVRTADIIGVESFAAHLRRLGFDTIVEPGDYYGGSLALGSADVSLWQLVNAYRTLADGGRSSPLRLTAGAPRQSQRIYSEAAAFVISDILSDRASRSATFGLENSLATRFWSAVKTGTSKDMRDNWCVGYTDRFTVGVWVGNFSGAPMHEVSGITGAAPVWLDVMNYLHDRFGSGPMPPPRCGVAAQPVSFPKAVEPQRVEWFIAGTEPDTPTVRLDAHHARIASPTDGTIIAIDPDIPRGRQRVSFKAAQDASGLYWILDRRRLGPARGITMWTPAGGTHVLSLADASSRALDTVTFKVRGANRACAR